MKLDDLFGQPDALPVISRVMQKLIARFNDEDVSTVTIGLRGSFKPGPGVDQSQFWHHSVHTAVASRYLAPLRDSMPGRPLPWD